MTTTPPRTPAPVVLVRDGCPLHAWVRGPVGAPAVAFVHGILMDHRIFEAQIDAVSAEYRTIACDVRGHGRSRPLGRGFSLGGAAEDLAAILDRVGADAVTLVGHSMGGYIAQELALRSPARVQALVAVSSSCLTGPQPLLMRLGLPLSVVGFRSCPDIVLRQLVAFGASRKAYVKSYARSASSVVGKREFDAIWLAIVRGFREVPGYRPTCPVLMMHGDRDTRVAFGLLRHLTRDWAARQPGSWYRVVPDAGHNAQQDNPAFVTRVLLEFLHEHVPPTGSRGEAGVAG